jgi:DnaJ-domain-containing protein 1
MLTDKLLDFIKAYVNDAVDKALDARGYKKMNSKEQKASEDDFEERFKKYQEQKKKDEDKTKSTKEKDTKSQESKQENKQESKKQKTAFDEFNDLFEKFKQYEKAAGGNDYKESEQQSKQQQNSYSNQSKYKTNSNTTKNATEEQYYKALELPAGASWDEIKAAYKREMKKYHPDKFYDNDKKRQTAEKISQKINEAYTYFEKKK